MNKKQMIGIGMAFVLFLSMTGCGKNSGIPKLKKPVSESVQSIKAQKKNITEEKVVIGDVTSHYAGCHYTEDKQKVEYQVTYGEHVSKGQVLATADCSEYEVQLEDLNHQLQQEKEQISYEKKHMELEIKQKKQEQKKAEQAEQQQKKEAQQKKEEQKKEEEKKQQEEETETTQAADGEQSTEQVKEEKTTEEQEAEEDTVQESSKAIGADIKRLETNLEYKKNLSDIHISKYNKDIAALKEKIAENTLTADVDGYVAYIAFKEDALAMENIIMIADTKELYVELQEDLPEPTQKAMTRVYTTYLGKEVELKELPYSESEQRLAARNSMLLRPRFSIEYDKMALGDYLDVHIVVGEADNAVTISKTCLYTSDEKQYVYKVVNGKKEKCFVETGITNGTEVEILSGIEEGDDIFYPIGEKIRYTETETVQTGSISLWKQTSVFKLGYPRELEISTGVDEAKLMYATDKHQVEKGELLATVQVDTGQADVEEISSQIDSLERQYKEQKKTGEEAVKQLKKQGDEQAVALAIAKLEMQHNEEEYVLQKKALSVQLERQKKKTGSISIVAPCSGNYESEFASDSGHTILRTDHPLGTLTDQTLPYYQADNMKNIFHYGDPVSVETENGDTYEGKVVGAYPVGNQEVNFVGEDDNVTYYPMDPIKQQTMAYIELEDKTAELTSGKAKVISNAIPNVIVLPGEDIQMEENVGEYVWVLKDEKPYKQYVVTLRNTDRECWVIRGLSEGDVILKGVE